MKFLYSKMIEILSQHNVEHIFGIVGDAINPMVEAIRKQDKIKFIHMVHEESGAFAASAASKLTGNLQVCAGTVGPGAIHLLNGLYDAKKDHTPVLAILGQVPTPFIGTDYHQEVHLASVFEHVAVYSAEITDKSQFPYVFSEACNTAIGEKGVSVIIIPHNIGSVKVEDEKSGVIEKEEMGMINPRPERLRKVIDLINTEESISILAGEGCRNSKEEVLALARKINAPIITSLRAKDIFHYRDEMVAGGLGLLGSRSGVYAMNECDVLLVLGSDFPYRDWYNQEAQIVMIDNKASAMGHRVNDIYTVHSDVLPAVEILLNNVEIKKDKIHLDETLKTKKLWDKFLHWQESADRSKDTIHPQTLSKTISEVADHNAIFTCDTGEVTAWAARHLYLRGEQRFSASFNLASMAYAMPAAIGASLTYPDRQVISLSGDGGFNMLMGDFLTAIKYKLPIKVVIFNNHKLGLIKNEQEVEGYPEFETGLVNPEYKLLAEALGGKGFKVTKPTDLEITLKEAFTLHEPVIVDVEINPDELTLPPKITAKQAMGFGLAKIKELFE
ncbi:MAG: ubiquinone-dependent pyruvate dehydrogenase [Bacteroidales bacterium]|nr:ubiquinone-dependent pyruvate dehydrogenase [Bacteroidales bacterium]